MDLLLYKRDQLTIDYVYSMKNCTATTSYVLSKTTSIMDNHLTI